MKIQLPAALIASALLLCVSGCVVPVARTQQPEATPPPETVQADVHITINGATGSVIRPLLGVNDGPLPVGNEPNNADLTAAYRQIGVNLIRTHDYYNALDMSLMYPDRTADPSRPQSYNFAQSDQAWKSITGGGFEPYFRLGDSYSDSVPPANAAERANWVKAAVEVLRHYRLGKWNGFNTNFRYVEVWNEPDNQQFWPKPRTPLEYFQLYCETATALKREFPGLKVGGPGVTPAGALVPQGRKWTQDFISFVRKSNAPLDFFSWHMYSNTPRQYAEAAEFYRTALDAQGFTQTTKHITEWNTEIKRGQESISQSMALRAGARGAAILSACWIELQQENDLEVSTFYRGNDTNIDNPTFYGMYYADGRPKPIAMAFSLWSKMTQYPGRIAITVSSDAPLQVLAGQNGAGRTALLVVNTGDKAMNAALSFADTRKISQVSLYRVSGAGDRVEAASFKGTVFETGAESVQLIVID